MDAIYWATGIFLIQSNALVAQAFRGSILYAQAGDEVEFSWQLPPDHLQKHTLVVSHILHKRDVLHNTTGSRGHHSDVVFVAAFADHNNSLALKMQPYHNRTHINHISLSKGLVGFTLKDVSRRDAGEYVCMKGLTKEDVVPDCGQTLVIVDAPVNASIILDGADVVGKSATIRCSAASGSVPRDHGHPMRFRWFEATPTTNETDTDWVEIVKGQTELPLDTDKSDNETEDDDEASSGAAEQNETKGDNNGSLINVLQFPSLNRSDGGRRFSCSASEGLGLWSTRSPDVVFSPEWKPLPSDISLVPSVTSATLTVGDSIDVVCSAECRPDCSVTWHKVHGGDKAEAVNKTGTLSLRHVSHHSSGFYRCRVANLHGSAFVEWKLTVKHVPEKWFRNTTHVIMVVVGVTVMLTLGMTGTAVAVVRCRNRSSPICLHQRRAQDTEPLPNGDRNVSNWDGNYTLMTQL